MAKDNPNRKRFSAREKMRIVVQLSMAPREGREQLVRETAERLQVSSGTLWRWLRRFREQGSAAFTKQARADRGSSRFFRDNLGIELFVIATFASGVKSPSAIRAAMARELGPEQIPALSTLRSYIKLHLEGTL